VSPRAATALTQDAKVVQIGGRMVAGDISVVARGNPVLAQGGKHT
jgi:hypothetical protein